MAARSSNAGPSGLRSPRFLTLDDVAEVLSTSSAQVYALVRRGELAGIKIGGRGQWRVEVSKLEEYIAAQYEQTQAFVEAHPFTEDGPEDGPPDELQGTDRSEGAATDPGV